jgi:hypothetical protein
MTVLAPTAAEARSHQTFNALLWAFSYPGRHFSLPVDGLGAFGVLALDYASMRGYSLAHPVVNEVRHPVSGVTFSAGHMRISQAEIVIYAV